MPSGQGLTLNSTATYRIRVQGRLDASWSDYLGGVAIEHQGQPGEAPVTLLSGPFVDQAALAGVLNTLYDLGFPLLTVECVGVAENPENRSSRSQPGGH